MRRSPYGACSDPGGGGIHYPDRMREAKVPITSRAECQTVYTAAGAPIDATMLCAGRTNLGNFILSVTGGVPVTAAQAA